MNYKIDLSLYKPNKINADYEFNRNYNFFSQRYNDRFNCPWENKLVINGDFFGTTSLNISVLIDTHKVKEATIENVIKNIFKYFEKQEITIALKNIESLKIIVSDKYLKDLISLKNFINLNPYEPIEKLKREYVEKIEKRERRGISFIYTNHKVKIFISLGGCELTIKNEKHIFEDHYPEYAHIKWTLNGMLFYVLTHEIVHILIPIDLGDEIYPLILGSRFAFENNFIAVPQGIELKNAWSCLGINLSKKLAMDDLDKELKKCKKWLESLPQNLEFLDNLS